MSKLPKNVPYDSAQSVARARRLAHFAHPGATPQTWRGAAQTFEDRRAKANRRACREFRVED
jgi:hypothetical protein